MDVKVVGGSCFEFEADAIVVPVLEGEDASEGTLKSIDEQTGGLLSEILGSAELRGKTGEMVFLHRPPGFAAGRLLLAGAGKRDDFDYDAARQMSGAAARFLRSKGVRRVALVRRGLLEIEQVCEALVEGALIGLFEPDVYRTEEREERRIESVLVCGDVESEREAAARGAERGRILAEATNFTRELVNEPGNTMTPTILAERASDMARRFGLEVDVLEEARMRELGMGALLGVARGSDEPARLVVLRYTPAEGATERTIGLVGKGITFDSGGISIKPGEGMEKMKYDMGGAAAVFGAMQGIAQLGPPVSVIGVAPLAENMPSGRALKPGDVVTSMAGKTIEILNTDAEGRLILADAIAYARRLGATEIVDLATLTGAVSIALGTVNAAVLGTDDELVEKLIAAGRAAGERLWRLPLHWEYREMIKSDIADIRNSSGRAASTIAAAHFVGVFAEGTPWAHLDIAGTAWQGEKRAHIARGPNGFGVRTLVNYVTGA